MRLAVLHRAAVALGLCSLLAALFSCSDDKKAQGELMIGIQTDMPIPKEIDTLRIEVTVNGDVKFGNDYDYRGGQRLPATIAVTSPDTNTPVRIRIVGGHGTKLRTLREAITTMPRTRTALLRMPVQWLCDESIAPSSGGAVVSSCGEQFTCAAGECVPIQINEADLPDYDPADIFGGGDESGTNGDCFDVAACAEVGTIAQTKSEGGRCTIPAPANLANVNIALRVPEGGICDSQSGTNCFIMLDGPDREGWTVEGSEIVLPPKVCERIDSGRIRNVVVTTACSSKASKYPPCGSWSAVAPQDGGISDAALRPSTPGGPPIPDVVGDFSTLLAGATVCCPLSLENNEISTCLCTGNSKEFTVGVLDLANGRTRIGTKATVSTVRRAISATVHAGLVYFIDNQADDVVLFKMGLNGGTPAELGRTKGEAFDDATLLADDTAVYSEVNFDGGDAGRLLNVLVFDAKTGKSESIPTGSDKALVQFVQDANSIYLVSLIDDKPVTKRTSRIVRLDKKSKDVKVLTAVDVKTTDEGHGGYFGVRVTDGNLFAVQEGDFDAAKGTYTTSLLQWTLGTTALSDPHELSKRLVRAGQTRVSSLGATGHTLLGLEEQLSGADVKFATVSLVDTTATRDIADFTADGPLALGSGVVRDAGYVYWVNRDGKIYRLAHAGL